MNISPDPYRQFTSWYKYRVRSYNGDPTFMVLATADAVGKPSARMVLLKSYDNYGFVFFTNYQSKKGAQIKDNPYGTLLFYWPELKRQIRIEGSIEKISPAESDEYFQSRQYLSKIGAHASNQSQVISGRKELLVKVSKLMLKYPHHVPCPEHWGGYRLTPELFEFWKDSSFRLHDRFSYTACVNGSWICNRLSP